MNLPSLFCITLLILLVNGNITDNLRKDYIKKFFLWMQEHNVTYKDQEEFKKRLDIFLFNDALIEKHNTADHPWKMSHNKFSDLTWSEFRDLMGFERNRRYFSAVDNMTGLRRIHEKVSNELPDSIDWVEKGAVTEVKDQGSCGSCWSFSTTGCMEGAYFKKQGVLKSFSEQQLVSCDTNDSGCNGGMMDYAFEWIKSNGGICLESDYPYVSGKGGNVPSCMKDCKLEDGTTPSLWVDVNKDGSSLMSALSEQPVSVAIEADQLDFQFYSSGIFTGSCGTNLDHGVLAVGYGNDNGIDYWKIKNSWGNTWGENGYIRLQRGKDQEGDQCGICLGASYVTL